MTGMSQSNTFFSQGRWSLEDLPPSDPKLLDSLFDRIEQQVKDFESLRLQLNAGLEIKDFMEAVHQIEHIYYDARLLDSYASLRFAEDTQDTTVLVLVSRVDNFMATISNRLLFFNLWWKELDNREAERFMLASGDYRYWLEEIRHFKDFTLSEAEEKIINIKNVTGANALNTLYDSITNRYTFKLRVDGHSREMTRGELMVYVRQNDPDLRKSAYQELYRVYAHDGPILGQIYQTLVRDWRNEKLDLRHFSTPVSARNLSNDIPDEVVDTLLDVCQKNTPLFQEYFQLKAQWLKQKRLRRYDIYAPVAHSNKIYEFPRSAWMVLDSFEQFDPRLARLALRVFEKNHIDSEVRKGKRGGAFCLSAAPKIVPWVHLNYQGRAEDVATMAHELGHAIHSMLSEQHTLFTFHACLPLAETASTFGEMMLTDRMLKEESSEDVRRDLLFKQIDDAYATIQRQAFFAMFERQAHEMVIKNATVEEISEAYLQNLRGQFGDAVDVSDEFRWEWVSIPHIYNVPFYVYAYAFGQLLVLSLYRQYQNEGDAFKPRYLSLLSAGGSKAPVSLLADAGIDVHQAAFWQGGFDVIKELVNQLKALPVHLNPK
jgi:oligoendopeptidase F